MEDVINKDNPIFDPGLVFYNTVTKHLGRYINLECMCEKDYTFSLYI